MLVRSLATALSAAAVLAGGAATALPATAAPPSHASAGGNGHGNGHSNRPVQVEDVFPDDALTVRDRTQVTGRRVALPLLDCAQRVTICDVTRLVDELDGFDLDPRMSLRFSGPVDAAAVAARTTVTALRGPGMLVPVGVDRVVADVATNTVFFHPQQQLAPSTTYRLRVRPGGGLPNVNRTFTTMSATVGLQRMVAQLDDGSAYARAGIAEGSRGLRVDRVVPAAGTVLSYTADRGPGAAPATSPVVNLSGTGAGSYVFGSYLAPSWLTPDRLIPQTPTAGSGPSVRGSARLPFVMIVPAGTAPAGGWPVAVYGHGFTRSAADVFLAAATNSARGLATVATDVVGHGYGAGSTWGITRGGVTESVPAYGRGVDADGNGTIESTEGVATPGNPSRLGAVANRDGLRQTVADVATLVRAVGRGVDLGAAGRLTSSGTTYYGHSFGGIYGTMVAGVDPQVRRAALSAPGGPVTEISRLSSSFRPLAAASLGGAVPSLLNGGFVGFTESMPLAGDAPVTSPAPGALAIQEYLSLATWVTRSGDPEAYAPLAARRPVLFQVAFGDQTVPNPTSRTLLAAGDLFDRTALYRNDRTPQAARNPHSFLLDPTFPAGALPGQQQIVQFLLSGAITDPDGPGSVWEVPVSEPDVLRNLNFPSPLHP